MTRIVWLSLVAALAVGCGKKENNDVTDPDTGVIEPDMGDDTEDMATPNNTTPDMPDPVDMRREPPTCGPFPVAFELIDADETGAFYTADASLTFPTDSLAIEIYDEPPTAGSYTLGENYETCLYCVLIYTDCDESSCGSTLLATGGTLNITEVGVDGGRFTGTLTNAQFEEVAINEDTFRSTPVPGGELRCVDSYSFDIFIGTSCEAEGDLCELGRAVEQEGFACVDDGTGAGVCAIDTPLMLPAICTDTTFTGQIGGAALHEGGTYTDVPYTVDTGLQAVWDAIPVGADAVTDLTATPIAVTSAVVTATSVDADANWQFWVQDLNVGLQLRLTDAAGTATPVAMDVKVGQTVSFSVTMVETLGGHPQIKEITGFTIESEGAAVYVIEKFDADITAADYGKIVRVGGVLGAPVACGSSMCYPLTHGAAADKTITMRSSSMVLAETNCAVFVGPATGDPGPKDAGGITAIQVDTTNLDWLLVP